MLHTAWILAKKDLRLFFRDRTALLLTFLLPLVLGAVFGTAMGGMGGSDGGGGSAARVDLAIEDLDDTEASRDLIAALEERDGLDVSVVAGARRLVADGDFACGLIVPAGYGTGVESGAPPDLALLRDPSQTISQQVVLFQLAPVLLQRQVDALGSGMMDRIVDLIDLPAGLGEIASEALRDSYARIETAAENAVPEATDGPTDGTGDASAALDFDPLQELPKFIGLTSEDVAGVDESGSVRAAGPSHAFASMAVMMLLFSVVGAGGTLLQERSDGTLKRLQLTPAAGGAVLIGKTISMGLISMAQLVVLFTFGAIAFGVPVLESPVLLTIVSASWVFLAVSIGMLFAVTCDSQKQLEGLSTLVILVMSAVGGAWFPREITPEWFQAVGGLTPVGWAMDAYHGVLWYGKGLFASADRAGIAPLVGLMLGVGAVLMALSFRLYRRNYAA